MDLLMNTDNHYFEHEFYNNQSDAFHGVVAGIYEHCEFVNCDFSGVNLDHYSFSACVFTQCNLSSVHVKNTTFRKVDFKDCKLMGISFDTCNSFLFEIRFKKCLLNFSVFYTQNLCKCHFLSCTLHEVDFSACDLSNLSFNNCDLAGATFDHTILLRTDFSQALQVAIDPTKNQVKGAKFNAENAMGLLHAFGIIIA